MQNQIAEGMHQTADLQAQVAYLARQGAVTNARLMAIEKKTGDGLAPLAGLLPFPTTAGITLITNSGNHHCHNPSCNSHSRRCHFSQCIPPLLLPPTAHRPPPTRFCSHPHQRRHHFQPLPPTQTLPHPAFLATTNSSFPPTMVKTIIWHG